MSGQLEDRILSFIEGRSEQGFETLARELCAFQREHNRVRYVDLEGEEDKGDLQNRQALSEGGSPDCGMDSVV